LPTFLETDRFTSLQGRPRDIAGPVFAHDRDAERFYRFPLTAPWARLTLIGALLVLLLFLAPRVWRHSLAEHLALNPTLENLQRAIALEPDRAEYHDLLGRVYLFSLSNYDPQRAADSLQRAVKLNPQVAGYWLDLATAYDSLGRKKDSVECVETARRYDPLNPQIAWTRGNIRAEAGDIPGALEAWHQALLEQPDDLDVGLDLAWKVSPDTQLLLDHLVPATNQADFRFLDFLSRGRMGQPELVWNRIIARGQPFPPRLAFQYFYGLLFKSGAETIPGRTEIARKAWRQLLHMVAASNLSAATEGGEDRDAPSTGAAAPETNASNADNAPSANNLLTNGGFEAEMLNMGFDWTWSSPKGAALVWDQSVVQEGRRSARIDFDGTESLVFAGLQQVIPVEPGHHYRLTSHLRAERIQGGAGICLSVARLSAEPNDQPLAHGQELFQTLGWVPDTIEFTAPQQIYLVKLGVQRVLRAGFRSKVSGSFGLDNVVLRDVGSAPQRGKP
jgi:tetratricopeptide (TPR) repeat protein